MDLAATLCEGRLRCEVLRVRPADNGVRTADVRLGSAPDAGDDVCSVREYWRLKDGEPPRLLAMDCDQQRSAEEAAAATTDVANGFFVVDYVELQASDQCERYQARLDLTTLKLVSDTREAGIRDGLGCRTTKRLTKLAPRGDGSRGRPILRLHVEWRDLKEARQN